MRVLTGIFGTLVSGMWHGYRRWASLFNALSIVLSVIMAVVILGFALGVRDTIRELVRKEAAAGAVRIHLSGWRPEGAEVAFRESVQEADRKLQGLFRNEEYAGFHFWWRSEAHFLMLEHPADSEGRGTYTKLGNTEPGDPEAARVQPYGVGGTWVESSDANQIVLSAQTARKLSRGLPDADSIQALLGRTLWITLPGTPDHRPAACAAVTVTGIFDHLRDQACLTTPGVIQTMYARTRANANGKWYETYDRMQYRVVSLPGRPGEENQDLTDREIPLICWRTPEDRGRWLAVRESPAHGELLAERDSAPDPLWVTVRPVEVDRVIRLEHPGRAVLPDSDHMGVDDLDERYPHGAVICSSRVWEDLGFEVAPLVAVEPWEDQAIYAYLYFDGLDAASRGRTVLENWGFETYMPIDRFQGLRALARVVTAGAVVLLAAVLLAGLLGILVTLYTEVDAEEQEIGLLKALGASNATIGWVFLGKGAMIGAIGVLVGVPLAVALGARINQEISTAVTRTVGLAPVGEGFYSRDPRLVVAVGIGVVMLAAVAALLPALQAAAKDPQEALRAE